MPNYNLRNIRILLTEGFNYFELRSLSYEELSLKPIYEQLSPSIDKIELIHKLIEFAEQRGLLELILSRAKEHNPSIYEKHEPYYLEDQTNPLLSIGQIVYTELSGLACTIEQFLGSNWQGETYEVKVIYTSQLLGLKWYFPHYLLENKQLRDRLNTIISLKLPAPKFVWPQDVVYTPGKPGFGYITPLREQRFKSVVDLLKRRVEPSFRTLTTIGFELAQGFFQLHTKGLCYRDINLSSIFFDPDTGEVCLGDIESIDLTTKPGLIGTPRFMAPELIRGEALPSRQTDLFSLAVLLFYIFMLHHPLEGKKEAALPTLDLPAMRKLYGEEPIFVFDPNNESNQPISDYHNNALLFWPIYPQFLRTLFIKAFTEGIHDPIDGRIIESDWQKIMIRLRDSIFYCHNCGVENFHDADTSNISNNKPLACWSCATEPRLPFRLHINQNVVLLNHNTQLFPYHIYSQQKYDFSRPLAEVIQNPKNSHIWGLRNLSTETWVISKDSSKVKEVAPGRSATLMDGLKIQFGKSEGTIRG